MFRTLSFGVALRRKLPQLFITLLAKNVHTDLTSKNGLLA